jgi:hypothetical protein
MEIDEMLEMNYEDNSLLGYVQEDNWDADEWDGEELYNTDDYDGYGEEFFG